VVVKPSEHAAGTAFLLGEILADAGLPAGVYNVVSGLGHEAGTALVSDPGVAMISFTGSSENGRRVMELASRTLKRVSLELGGKSPVIVFADADLDEAVEGVISGFTTNAGQCCIATTRLLLERSGAERFKARLRERLAGLRSSQPLATAAQQEKVIGFIERGRESSPLLSGGELSRTPGAPVPPTVFDEVAPGSPLAREEIFGPVLVIHSFDTEDEAVRLANDTAYGLAACIWSRDARRALRVARRVRAGRLWINSAQQNFPEMPVGGFGASGIGREAGSSGIRTYCELKSLIVRGS
jgi:acyl-CoA reductase-like NAD-dependent aldehyde dehydrogenase